MSRFPGRIERRIFEAALVALTGCHPAAAPVGPVGAAPPGSTDDAKALCAGHKRTSHPDRSQVREGAPQVAGVWLKEEARWNLISGLTECTIIHDRVPGIVEVMGGGRRSCPRPGVPPTTVVTVAPINVLGHKVLVERVSIRADGHVVTRELAWIGEGVDDTPQHNCGRRFEGFELSSSSSDTPGAQLAAMAELEAASVPAFERLARELAAWGAPASLVRGARRAMGDEIRHARVMRSLALAYGHAPRAISVPPLPCRSLAAIAHENVVEGCVREAFGALVATYQAERARPELRDTFAAIAHDERAHAALSEAVHAWISDRLDTRELEQARTTAETELRADAARARACDELGLPGAAAALALCDAYFS